MEVNRRRTILRVGRGRWRGRHNRKKHNIQKRCRSIRGRRIIKKMMERREDDKGMRTCYKKIRKTIGGRTQGIGIMRGITNQRRRPRSRINIR